MKPPPLAVKDYFFPATHLVALSDHDPAGDNMGTQIETVIEHVQILESGDLYFQVQIKSDLEKSKNPPFDFSIIAFGLFSPTDTTAAKSKMGLQFAFSTLVGAAREHIATLSSKTPWAKFILPPIVLSDDIFDAKAQELKADQNAE